MNSTIIIKTKPVSVNKRYTIARGRNILSNEYRSTKEAIAWEIASQWRGDVLNKDGIAVNIIVYYSGRKPDIDAYEKLLLDAMSKVVYEDDGLIDEKHTFRVLDKENPRIEIQVL